MVLQAAREGPAPALRERIVRTYYPPAASKGVGLATFDDGLPDTLVCDATWLAQVFNNLLSNARSPTRARSCSTSPVAARAQWRCATAGCGIPG